MLEIKLECKSTKSNTYLVNEVHLEFLTDMQPARQKSQNNRSLTPLQIAEMKTSLQTLQFILYCQLRQKMFIVNKMTPIINVAFSYYTHTKHLENQMMVFLVNE